MNDHDHHLLLELAFDCLPLNAKERWSEFFSDAMDVCMYPDTYAVELLSGINGPWSKYFSPKKSSDTLPKQSQSALHECLPDIKFYVDNVVKSIKQKEFEEAHRFIGVFSHLLGDFSQPAHWFETEIALLLPSSPSLGHCHLHSHIEGISATLESIEHTPRIIGNSKAELVFKSSSRFSKIRDVTVAAIIPMIQEIYSGTPRRAIEFYNPVICGAAEFLADFCLTVYALGNDKFSNDEIRQCSVCELSEILPDEYDVEEVFGRRPLSGTINPGKTFENPVYLCLKISDGKLTSDGICAIPYALPDGDRPMWSCLEYRLPKGIYSEFKVLAGLCYGIALQSSCRFEVCGDDQTLFSSEMRSANDPPLEISVNISSCEILKLVVHADGSTDKLAYPIWANGALDK